MTFLGAPLVGEPVECPCQWQPTCVPHSHARNSKVGSWQCVAHEHADLTVTIEDQPPPSPNDDVAVWDLVIVDMQARDRTGRERYGTPLQVDNGRDHLVDAYQEGLDFVVYVRAEIERRTIEWNRALDAVTEALADIPAVQSPDGDQLIPQSRLLHALTGLRRIVSSA